MAAAQRMATTLAATVEAGDPGRQRSELLTRALQLRTETIESAAIAGTGPGFGAAWTYLAAAEDLGRTLVGPEAHAGPRPDGVPLAAALRVVEQRCDPAADSDAVVAAGAALGGPAPAGTATARTPRPTTRATLDVARMAAAVDALQRLEGTTGSVVASSA